MTVKEVFVVEYGVVGAEEENVSVSGSPAELAQSGLRDLLQHPPHHLMSHTANIELDSPVQEPGLQDLVGGGRSGPLLRGDQ